MRILLKITVFFIIIFSVTSCGTYHMGSPLDPAYKTIKLDSISNLGRESQLGIYASSKIRTSIVSDGNLKLVENGGDLLLDVKVRQYELSSAGNQRLESVDEDQRRFTTSIRRVTVTLEYSLKKAKDGKFLIENKSVSGSAEFSDLLDINSNLQDGIQQAMHAAAQKLIASVLNSTW